MRSVILLVAILLLAQVLASAAETPKDPFKDEVITREERALGLVTIYANARQHYAYFDLVPKLDWDKAFTEYLPQVEKKQSLYDYYRVLQRFIALLEDGHTTVNFPQSIAREMDGLPIRVDKVEGRWITTGRSPTEEVRKEDIPFGSEVISIEGESPDRYFVERLYPYIAAAREEKKRDYIITTLYRKNSQVKMVLRYPDGSVHERALKANRSTITKLPQDIIARYIPAWRYGPGFSSSEPEPGILYIAFRSCDQESEKKAVDLLESRKDNWPEAVVLDLRANPGGMTPLRLFEHLIPAPAKWDVGTTRWSMSYMDAQTQGKSKAEKASWMKQHGLPSGFEPGWCPLNMSTGDISPAKIHYDGPLVVLAGPSTGSASEQLVVMLQQSGRAKIIGERTAGVGGQPMSFDLPGGGTGRVCTTRSRYVDGREYAHVGCEPDIPVTRTIRGITEGRDEVLDAALSYLRKPAN